MKSEKIQHLNVNESSRLVGIAISKIRHMIECGVKIVYSSICSKAFLSLKGKYFLFITFREEYQWAGSACNYIAVFDGKKWLIKVKCYFINPIQSSCFLQQSIR